MPGAQLKDVSMNTGVSGVKPLHAWLWGNAGPRRADAYSCAYCQVGVIVAFIALRTSPPYPGAGDTATRPLGKEFSEHCHSKSTIPIQTRSTVVQIQNKETSLQRLETGTLQTGHEQCFLKATGSPCWGYTIEVGISYVWTQDVNCKISSTSTFVVAQEKNIGCDTLRIMCPVDLQYLGTAI